MHPLIVILGPTACGKTRLATHLAHQLNGAIISADSRQVYRSMDIGTGKDLSEYIIEGKAIPYHLIDILEAGQQYNVHAFQQDFKRAMTTIQAKHQQPILCGGTGLYIEAVLQNHQFTAIPINEALRQQLAHHTDEELQHLFRQIPSPYSPLADTSTRKRLIRAIEISTYLHQNPEGDVLNIPTLAPPEAIIIGLSLPLELRRERITERLYERLRQGMVEEVQNLLNRGLTPEQLIYYGLEYKFITQYLTGELNYQTMVQQLNVAIHQFAKRQMTYFRKMQRDGLHIHWLDATLPLPNLIEATVKCLSNVRLKN